MLSSARRLLLVAMALVTILIIFFVHILSPSDRSSASTYAHQQTFHSFVVNTLGCKIPASDPYDDTVRHLVNKLEPLVCNATLPALTYVEGQWLRINRTNLKLFYPQGLSYCEYQSILRPHEPSDNVFKYSKPVQIHNDTKMEVEYIRVACRDKIGDMMYTNFHAFILDKGLRDKARLHQEILQKEQPKETWNIILVGVDSISRLNFMRQMPKTREYLLDVLGAVELQGYNKVADNTHVNLVPMFAGKFVEELPWDDLYSDVPFDSYNFIWKNFSNLGYATSFGEDAPNIAIFNYDKAGFHTPPTDYYLRPFSLALEDHTSMWSHDHDCVGPTLETDVVLNWLHDFVDHTDGVCPYWAFAFITRLTHDNIHKASLADDPYLTFIKKLHTQGHLENSIFIFFSDHGMRFGPIRETYIGKLEERLPFMYITLPSKFKSHYPQHYRDLQTNANRLTTPFDIHETLVDLLKFTGHRRTNDLNNRGMSLFSEVPVDRTCEHAAIAPHWCTCHQLQTINTQSPIILAAAHYLVNNINSQLDVHHGLCATLTLDDITDARLIKAKEQVFQPISHIPRKAKQKDLGHIVQYLLTIRTKPGGALFEATVTSSGNSQKLSLSGDISRINKYGDQSVCIDYHRHKKLCYCI